MVDEFNLDRFVEAQDQVYAAVVEELRTGGKQSHWMWYVFPQVEGLGFSSTARRYAIASLGEARAYVQHSVLGPRLRQCVNLVMAVNGLAIEEIFPYPDYLKFLSCMTLFELASEDSTVFGAPIEKYFQGMRDEATQRIVSRLHGDTDAS